MRIIAFYLFILASPITSHASLSDLCGNTTLEEGCNVYQKPYNTPKSTLDNFFGRHIAVIVGVSDYRSSSGYNALPAALKDTMRVRDFLINEAKFDIVVTLTNKMANRNLIESVMLEEIPSIISESNKDRFLFYFSGHGDTQTQYKGRKKGYLVTSDAKKKQWSRMISMDHIYNWSAATLAAHQGLWVIDTCFAGLTSPKSDSLTNLTKERLAQRGHHLFTAGLEGEEAITNDNGSVFTNAFLDAARYADNMTGDGDGIVSLGEMYTHVGKNVDRNIDQLNNRIFGRKYKMSPRIVPLHDDNGQFYFMPSDKKKSLFLEDREKLKGHISQKSSRNTKDYLSSENKEKLKK